MVQTRSGARRARTESFGYQTPFLVSREFERYERKFMIALQSVDFSPLHMAMKLVGQCCSGEVLVLYFAVLYWVVDQRYVFFFIFSLFSLVQRHSCSFRSAVLLFHLHPTSLLGRRHCRRLSS